MWFNMSACMFTLNVVELKLASLIVWLRLDDNCVNSLLTSRTEPLKVKWTEFTSEIFQILMYLPSLLFLSTYVDVFF